MATATSPAPLILAVHARVTVVCKAGEFPATITSIRMGKYTATLDDGRTLKTSNPASFKACTAPSPHKFAKGDWVAFTEKGKEITGRVERVTAARATVQSSDGISEYGVPFHMLRKGIAPTALPPHPTMVRWTLGKKKNGLVMQEGRSWEAPIIHAGFGVGVVREEGMGGDFDYEFKTPALRDAFFADAKKWTEAVGDAGPHASSQPDLWVDWEMNDRPMGREYQTLAQRFGK